MKSIKQFVNSLERYIKSLNFNGTNFYLKKNILNRIKELEEEYSQDSREANK